MENVIAQLLHDFENGKMNRRELVRQLALAATAASTVMAAAPAVAAPAGFKTTSLDHISYQVANYKKTRDFYADLMGMKVLNDNGSNQCELHFGESMIIARNRAATATSSRVDHISYRITDWNTDRVKAELDRRGLKPRLDTGGTAPHFASFHVQDPDGFDLQISGTAQPGDSAYKK
jgi:catechol 2,3-dioxygenase-like lactoylglutathione lyase family enzyme